MFGIRPGGRRDPSPISEASKRLPDHPPIGAPPGDITPIDLIFNAVLSEIEPAAAASLTRPELADRIRKLVGEVMIRERLVLNPEEQDTLSATVLHDLTGLGPLENLLQDDTVSDILVNGAQQIFVERRGKLELTGLHFRDDRHVVYLAQQIASSIGRYVDESSPMLDARLPDGSRVNVVIPPIILNGPSISIRKFNRTFLSFARMIELNSVSPALARVLEIAARCRLNILISGGTGSGKTTLLNALSGHIHPGERVVTIEDTAELQLQQPHVLRMEMRLPDLEGKGEVTQRDLVRNALRMRPDRIIVGEVRGPEAFDMLQAMNTGHSGSMSTVHANSTRDALVRVENMVLTANNHLPLHAIRSQLVSALDLVIQVERLRDGSRRVTELSEVVGLEEEIIVLSSLFSFEYADADPDGTVRGTFLPSGIRPRFFKRLNSYGLGESFLRAISP